MDCTFYSRDRKCDWSRPLCKKLSPFRQAPPVLGDVRLNRVSSCQPVRCAQASPHRFRPSCRQNPPAQSSRPAPVAAIHARYCNGILASIAPGRTIPAPVAAIHAGRTLVPPLALPARPIAEMLWPWLGGTEPCSTWLSRNITRFHYDWLSDTNPWSVLLARPMACQVTRAGRGSPNFAVRRWVLARRQVRPFLGRAWVTELHGFTVESYPSDHAAKGRKAAPRRQLINPHHRLVDSDRWSKRPNRPQYAPAGADWAS